MNFKISHKKTKCIDLFAGPGGLGEGFTRAGFSVAISIEKEATECETLRHRKLYHKLLESGQSDLAAELSAGHVTFDQIGQQQPALVNDVDNMVAQIELGEEPFSTVYKKISRSLPSESHAPLLLLGGPPCQAYSLVGRSRNIGKRKIAENPELLDSFYGDARHTLYREYLKVLSVFRPDIFIMENVKGILSARTGPDAAPGSVMSNIIRDLYNPAASMVNDHFFQNEIEDLGIELKPAEYILVPLVEQDSVDLLSTLGDDVTPRDFLIRCEQHGVPQTRHRVIICGIRKDIFKKKGLPDKLKKQVQTATVRDVLATLPSIRSDITKEKLEDKNWNRRITREIKELAGLQNIQILDNAPTSISLQSAAVTGDTKLAEFLEDAIAPITGHKTRKHMASDLARYYFCADFAEREGRSPKIHDWPAGKLAPNHKDVRNQGNRLISSGFSDRFKVQLWDKPASTITSHISKDGHHYIHPDKTQCRSFSVREAARIQTFPDSYYFCGSLTKQFHQVGNAVPPYIAFQIANIFKKYLET